MQENTTEKALSAEKEAHLKTKEQVRYYQNQLRELALELSLAEERERRLIASDLHDHIGQALAFIKMKISSLQGNTIFCGFENEFSQIMQLLKQTITYTRDLTFEISPPVLYEFGLPAALEILADNFQKKHHIKVRVIAKGKKHKIDNDLQVMLYKSVRELLKNIEKHAAAHRVDLIIKHNPDRVDVTVSDDGKGFNPDSIMPGSRTNRSFGLLSIKERLSWFGGEMQIDSAPGKGTTIVLRAPATTNDE